MVTEGERYMYNFMGQHSHTIDAKSRLIIPAKFREALGEQFVLTLGQDPCLIIYPLTEWETYRQKLDQLPQTTRITRDFRRFFIANATTCELDKQGRIIVPPGLRQYASLDKDVVIIGNGNFIEIWNKEEWDDTIGKINIDMVTAQLHEMGFMF